jgi:phosphoribosyl 1,2-cyclic phosphodiesterase
MKIKLWGVRGSLPAPLAPDVVYAKIENALNRYVKSATKTSPAEFLRTLPKWETAGYGGHTACIEVLGENSQIIIDGGSGIRPLGQQMMAGPAGVGRGNVHIFMTHFHWDHLIGLPFFTPLFIPGNKIHFYAVQKDLEKNIRTVFTKPYFPVEFDMLRSTFEFHYLEPRTPTTIEDLIITPYHLDHPDPCWGYKIVHKNKGFSHTVDNEYTRMSAQELGPDIALYQNVDLMLFDAQYTFKEANERINWGHGAAPIGIDIALRENVKKIYFMHHDPSASDKTIAQAEEQTKDYFSAILGAEARLGRLKADLEWGFAQEGTVFEV